MSFKSGIYRVDDGSLLLGFDTYIENSYHNSNNVAFEPLERGTFSSDSRQNTPFIVSVTAIFSIKNNDDGSETVDSVKDKLQNFAKQVVLVNLFLQPFAKFFGGNNQYYQYGNYYTNLALMSIDYQNTPEQLEFRPTLVFQEIRLTDTEYTQTQNTANPENKATSNAGQVQPQTSFAFDAFGTLGLPL